MSSNSRIYLSPPCVDQEEEIAILEALRSGWVAPFGPKIDQFQSELSTKFGYSKVLAVNSGTSALHLAVKLANVKKNTKVLIGSFTFVAAANAVLYEGGEPVFIDSESATWNIDPILLEERLIKAQKDNEQIGAVIITHIYGIPAQIERIQSICKHYKVMLIEDAAEAVGATVNGKFVGSFGDFGILSFNGNKIITTSGGGALICKQAKHHEKAIFLAHQAKDHSSYYQHSELGYNYALSNVLAGIGLSQLNKLERFKQIKEEIYHFYKLHLSQLEVFDFTNSVQASEPNYWLSTILIKPAFLSIVAPRDIIEALEQENIEARRFWKPMHLQPLFEGNEYVGEGVAEDLFERGICLPSGSSLAKQDQHKIVDTIKGLLTRRGLFK